jgi:signal transduction histidine kinase
MKKILFILLLFFQTLYSVQNIEIEHNNISIEKFSMAYLYDDKNILEISDILNSNFKSTINHNSSGIFHNITWYKINIKNKTNQTKERYLHSNFAYMSKEISIYEFIQKKEVNHSYYDLFDKKIKNKLIGSTLVYGFKIAPKSTKTLYIKNHTQMYQFIDLNIYNHHNSNKALINKSFYSNILVSILFALGSYNLLLFIFTKAKEFAYYSLYLINGAIGLFYLYGIIYNNFDIYGTVASWFNITAILVSPFLILFIKSVFDIKKEDKRLNKLLNSVLYLSVLFIFSAIFINLNFTMKGIGILFLYTFIVLIYLGIYFYRQNHPLAKLFLTAYMIYIIGMGLTISMVMGFVSYNPYLFHASGLGLVFEAILFSYLMNYRMKLLEKDIIKNRNIIILKNKKAQIGDMIAAIAHQWKQPLNAISSVSTVLQYRLKKEETISPDYLKTKLSKINEKIIFLVETIDDFKTFFNPSKISEDTDLKNVINKTVSLCEDDMLANEINLNLNLNFSKKINLYPNELVHILLNLIGNSKEAFIKNSIENRSINIVGKTEGIHSIIDVIDNAGGIKEEFLSKIFDEFYTTKNDIEGSGLGLYITKIILKEQLHGSIEVKRINNGIKFRIIL